MKPDASVLNIYEHDDFVKGINTIVDQIENAGYKPDIIVGLARGGCVPAVYLSHLLHAPLKIVEWSTTVRDRHLLPDLRGKKLLVVDDIIDGGETVGTLLKVLTQQMEIPEEDINLAALFYNESQEIVPNFFHRVIDRDVDARWVVFPWEA